MTPKEKANKLVDTFRMFADGVNRQEDQDQIDEHLENAKQCALIAVDEILSLMIKFHGRHIENNLTEIEYWEEVKNEIELF